ncbi:SDR family oxidoreductase [Occallatibacter savannae]|uniref:SDR family oxidoreductase n=1 Tax=Occallatibacter savannae TaxID=1002691 RepID=UPI000D6940A4|nr:SDR family oxidoreductase [Occallatibacter savannae]
MATKTVLITGASTGIGKATALYFQQQGWNVVATMRNPADGAELQSLDRILVTALDVTKPDTIQQSVAAAIDRFGSLDVLVNNAGFGAYGPLEATSMEIVRQQFDTNVIGLLETTRAVLPHMRAQHSGVIINISSIGGKVTFPFGTLYHGTKFAVEGISESLAYEAGAIGVKVKIVEPGAIKTDFATRSFKFSNDESLAEYQPLVGGLMTVMGPLMEKGAEPVIVAEVIYRAATDGSDQLRYAAGDDAQPILDKRKGQDDHTFMTETLAMFS